MLRVSTAVVAIYVATSFFCRSLSQGSTVPSQDVHPLGGGERALATRLVIPGVPPFGLRHRRREFLFQVLFRFFYRSDRRLAFVLGRHRLRRHQSRLGIAGGLTDGRFELRDIGAARTGLGITRIEAKHHTKQEAR